MSNHPLSIAAIEDRIRTIRGHRVLLDADLAELYGVPTKTFNQAVKRNARRFPADFRFQSTEAEHRALRLQIATSNGRGGRRYLPWGFTEQGVAMLSSVLHSDRAILVNIEIMRTFVRLRHLLATNTELARRLDELESRYDRRFAVVFEAIRQLMAEPTEPQPKVGSKPGERLSRGR